MSSPSGGAPAAGVFALAALLAACPEPEAEGCWTDIGSMAWDGDGNGTLWITVSAPPPVEFDVGEVVAREGSYLRGRKIETDRWAFIVHPDKGVEETLTLCLQVDCDESDPDAWRGWACGDHWLPSANLALATYDWYVLVED